jgi:hypothetical protein
MRARVTATMQRAVELSVAAAVQAHAVAAPGGAGDRRGARLHREVPVAGEALGAGGVADQRRGGERRDPRLGQQLGPQRGDRGAQLALQRALGAGELADAPQLVARDPHARAVLHALKAPRDARQPARAVQRASRQRGLEVRVELDQVPAQPVLMARALGDEVAAMIGQQPDLERARVQMGRRERLNALPERRARDRRRVDRIGLSRRALAAARLAHQPGRHAHHALAMADQRALQPARHVPAVLDRPHPLRVQLVRPPPPGEHPAGVRAHRARR